MTVAIASALVRQILGAAAATPSVEVCGLLFGDPAHVVAATACRNVASDPVRAFEIDPADLFSAHRAARGGGPRVIGHYHSHPTGRALPSARDAAMAPPDGALWLIVGGGDVTAWRAVARGVIEGRFEPVALAIAD